MYITLEFISDEFIILGLVTLKELGLDVEVYYASEINENALAVSQENHDGIIYLGDVRLKGKSVKKNLSYRFVNRRISLPTPK